MSDSSTAAHQQSGDLVVTGAGADRDLPEVLRPAPVAMLVVEAATGRMLTANAAARRWLGSAAAAPLAAWLGELAFARVDRRDVTAVHTWGGPGAPAGSRAVLSAECTPLVFRGRDCLLVVLRDALAPMSGEIGTDDESAVFTFDAVGRVDAWSPAAQRLTGFGPETTLGSDAGALQPGSARLSGEPHRALTHAFRTGEHRTEGWRLRSDGTPFWAEVTTSTLYDAHDQVVGFAVVLTDTTARRRLTGRPVHRVPGQVAPSAGASLRTPRRPAVRVPAQRRPAGR